MATGQLAGHHVLLATAVRMITGTTHASTTEAYKLIANQDKGFTNYVQPWDLVVNTTDNTSAHVLKVIDNDELLLNANIFTVAAKNFAIYRGARYALLPPPGVHIEVRGVIGSSPTANDKQGLEIQSWDDFSRRRLFLYRSGSTGFLEKVGRELGATNEFGLLVVNYSGRNATVRIDARDVTV